MADAPDMAPILAALKPELDRGVRRIHIWDVHNTAEPHQIAFSPELEQLIRRYGKPAYVIEDASGPGVLAHFIDELMNLTPDEIRARVQEMIASLPEGARPIAIAQFGIIDRRMDGASLIFPDSRAVHFTPREAELYANYMGAIANVPVDQIGEFSVNYREHLPTADQTVFNAMIGKIADAARDIDGTNRNMLSAAECQIRAIDPNGIPAVSVWITGAMHYMQPHDLDDAATPSVSVAVFQRPGGMADFYGMMIRGGKSFDLPQYAYYSETGRMVKLDTDEAKAEFIGVGVEQYRAIVNGTQDERSGDPRFRVYRFEDHPIDEPVQSGPQPPGTIRPVSATVAPPNL